MDGSDWSVSRYTKGSDWSVHRMKGALIGQAPHLWRALMIGQSLDLWRDQIGQYSAALLILG